MKYLSHSANETQLIASKIAENYKNVGGIIALEGDLAAGKTTFTQGFAKAMGIEEKVISPTFILVRQHQIPNENRFLFHLDLYRLDNINSIEELGIKDMMENNNNIVIIEWAEKIENLLPKSIVKIIISKISVNEREIIVQ